METLFIIVFVFVQKKGPTWTNICRRTKGHSQVRFKKMAHLWRTWKYALDEPLCGIWEKGHWRNWQQWLTPSAEHAVNTFENAIHFNHIQRNWIYATNSNFSNAYIFATRWLFKPIRTCSLNNPRATTLGCKYIRIRKSEFVAKTQFLFRNLF